MTEEKTEEQLFWAKQLKEPTAPKQYNEGAYQEAYDSLTFEEKMLLEAKAQTYSLRSIQANIRFFVGLTVLSIIVSVIITTYMVNR